MIRILILLALLFTSLPALAVEPDEILQDQALEQRARAISSNLRCLVCQNQSIDDSGASLARDLRIIVRERLTAGDSDAQVYDFVVSRYGNFVLLKPPFQFDTLALWLGPFIIFAGALATFFFYVRRNSKNALDSEPLTDEEQRQLAELEKSQS